MCRTSTSRREIAMDESFNENAVSNATEAVGDRAARVADQAKSAGRAAVDTIDDKREAAARTLSSTASKIRAKASQSEGRLSGAAHKTANTLDATADFMRDHPVSRVKDDLESFAKRNPGAALLIAAGVGFIVGRSLTRD
jgi:ElaB/YqjD/DUF883 family membrane-anchored ribosome-binding protein